MPKVQPYKDKKTKKKKSLIFQSVTILKDWKRLKDTMTKHNVRS